MRKKRGKSTRQIKDENLLEKIKKIFENSRETYGSPRITAELKADGNKCSRNRVARIMQENGIVAKTKKKFKITTHSKHDKLIAPNLLNRNFKAERPDQIWASDITHIWTKEGWLYLTVILDMFARKVIGWAMDKFLKADMVKSALLMAILRRKPGKKVIFHSDKGVQYASNAVRAVLKAHEFNQSMSGTGNCFDNAPSESFFHTLKTEHVYFENFETREIAKASIFEYTEIFYNKERRHSHNGYLSPDEFERKYFERGSLDNFKKVA